MSQNQFPGQYRSPSTPAVPANPAANRCTPGVTASPAALGVKPDARLANAFLTQAFVWMFAGLLVTAGVASVVQSNPRLLEFAKGSFFFLFIVQLGIVIGITAAINRISATRGARPVLRLRRVARGHDRADRRELHDRLGRDRVPERVGDVRRGGHLRPRHPALAGERSAGSCSWA